MYARDEIAIITTEMLLKLRKLLKAMMFHVKQVPAWRILSMPPGTYDCL